MNLKGQISGSPFLTANRTLAFEQRRIRLVQKGGNFVAEKFV